MATAAPDDPFPLRRSNSMDWLPPHMSELRLVLLGNSWSESSSVGNFILGKTEFNTEEEPDKCLWVRAKIKEKYVFLINTPDLLSPNISENKLTEHVTNCVKLSDPGPHVFLLVLKSKDFTEEQKLRLCRVLTNFSDKSFDHSLILISPPREQSSDHSQSPALKDLIRDCRNRYLERTNLDHSELLTHLGQVVKENNGEHVNCDVLMDPPAKLQREHEKTRPDVQPAVSSAGDEVKQSAEHLRIVLIGKTGNGKSSSGNTILGREEFIVKSNQTSVTRDCQKADGEVDGRLVSVVDTPGLFDTSSSHKQAHEEMIKCFSLLAPGPHVFLLVIRIGRFTHEEKETLKLIREVFGKDAEKFTIILLTGGDSLKHDIEEYIEKLCHKSFKKRIHDCGGRYHVFNNRDRGNREQVSELMTKIDTLVETNGGSCFTNEMLQEAETAIKKETEKLMKEKEEEMKREMKREREELQRKHEEDMKEMKERMTEQEELQRLEWKQKIEVLEKKMKSESEGKESIERKLEETREKMRVQRESWERKQKEWWEKRNKEEEERRQEEETRIRKLQEEFEQEREKYEKKRREEDLKKQEEEDKLKIQQREETEKERKQKEKELKEIEENIKKEREARVKEQEKREEEDRKRKGEEKLQRLEWKQKLEALKKQMKLETEEKESVYKQLEENRVKMRVERERWERKQEEWWEKRNQEEEERRQEERMKLRKLQEEFEQEREKYEKKRREKEKLNSQQREEIEKERKQKEKELKEMEENIKKEREARMKERQMREEEDKKRKEQEEHQRLEWEQNCKDLETEIKLETEEREKTERKLKETKEQLEEERENWEKKQREWWEKRFEEYEKIRTEEQAKLRKLQEEYETEKEKERKKREKEDRIRKKQEEKEKKALKMRLNIKVENLKQTHEEEVRRKDEEFNELQKESAALKEEIKDRDEKYERLKSFYLGSEVQLQREHRSGLYDSVKRVIKNRQNVQKINELLEKQEQEMTKEESEEEKPKLREIHEKELNYLLEGLTDKEDSSSWCVIS